MLQEIVVPDFPEATRQERIQTILLEEGGLAELMRRGVPAHILRTGGVDTISCALRLLQAGVPNGAFKEGYEFSIGFIPHDIIMPLIKDKVLIWVTDPNEPIKHLLDTQAMVPFEVVFTYAVKGPYGML